MWRKRLFTKLFLTYTLIILFCMAVVGGYVVRNERSTSRRNIEEQLERLAHVMDDRLGTLIANGGAAEADALAKRLGKETRTRMTLIDPEGIVVADTDGDPASMEKHSFRPEVQGAINEQFGSSLRFSTTIRTWFLYVAIPSRVQPGWVVRVAIPVEQFESHVRRSTNVVVLGAALAGLMAIILGLYFTRRITRPLENMRQSLEKLERGEFGVRLDPGADDEVGQLARTLNRVQEELEKYIQRLTRQKSEREAILSSMVEGLLAVDAEDRILLMNRSACKLLGTEPVNVENRGLVEAIRQPDLVSFVQRVRLSRSPVAAELVMHDPHQRWLELHGAPLSFAEGQEAGAVVVLNDVTRIHKLEQARKDFVGNVSHELKTPVTTIKGFLETLLQGGALDEPDSARRFLGIIARHTERLSIIIEDLLYLSRLEYEEAEIVRHPVNLALVAESSVTNFEHLAQSHNIQLSLRVESEGCTVLGDSSLLTRALDNLIENAIKYSPQGGAVEVLLVECGEELRIAVRDHGIGIAEEHLPRISERFYRVDAARSREMGGTGLGLAIVKHVALVHAGRLHVASTLGQGSCFTLSLPLARNLSQTQPDAAGSA